jgi:hypothetical protein
MQNVKHRIGEQNITAEVKIHMTACERIRAKPEEKLSDTG